jgi:tetratricopeptide (TPR) repeat protein
MANSGWPSGITAWVWSERARLDAAEGDEAEARRSLETAMSAAANDPDHLNLFAPGRDSRWLARRPAWVALHLGHSQEAITMLEHNRAGADEGLPREMVWNSIELAEAWAEHGDLDNALVYLDDALDRAEESADRRGAAHVVRVRSRRLSRWGNDPRLRQFDRRIQMGGVR